MKHTVLYEGSSYNGLGDHRHQQILQITNKIGLSILGPVKRADYLYGLPNQEEEFCEVPANKFKSIPGSPFKVAALLFLDHEKYPGMKPYNGLYFRAVGYVGAGSAYDRNWSGHEIGMFIDTIKDLDESGIQKDPYLEDQWNRQLALSELREAYNKGEIEFEVGENIPPHFGNPSIDSPVEFMFATAYIPDWCNNNKTEWKGMAPIGAKLKKIKVFKKEPRGNLWLRMEVILNGKLLVAESSASIKRISDFICVD